MRVGLFILGMLLFCRAAATNFYLSNSGNDAWIGTKTQAPWQTLSKLQSVIPHLKAGDSILLKRGDRFFGQLDFKSIANASSCIYLGAYGIGENPVISGFANDIAWEPTLMATLWKANVKLPSTNYPIVINHHRLVDRGRYPDTGYITYQLVKGSANTIKVSQLTENQHWEGADFMMRKEHWIFDASKVIMQQGNQFTVQPPNTENYYAGKDGFGLFVQNHLGTLNLKDEWKYDFTSQQFIIKTLGASPEKQLRIGVLDYLLNIHQTQYLTIENLQFEGANGYGVLLTESGNIQLKKCSFKWLGLAAIQAHHCNDLQIELNQFEQLPNNGIKLECLSKSNFVIKDNQFQQIAMIAGLQASGDGNGKAIFVAGNHTQISKNNLDRLGYIGIEFQGNNLLVDQNIIQNFCMVKDDGGAIYTWLHWGHQQFKNRTIKNNLILFAHGAAAGTTSKTSQDARGIYLDGGTTHVRVQQNTVAYCNGGGIYLNSAQFCDIQNNILFSNQVGICMNSRPELPPIRNIQILSNKIISNQANQSPIFYWNGNLKKTGLTSIEQDLQNIARFNGNQYFSTNNRVVDYFYHQTENGRFVDPAPLSLENWQQLLKQDLQSKYVLLPPNVTDLFLCYKTANLKTTYLPQQQKNMPDQLFKKMRIRLKKGQSTLIYKQNILD